MRRRRLTAILLLLVLTLIPLPAQAQSYSFSLDAETVDLYLESDGSARVEYSLSFTNTSSSQDIDFVDIGVPTESYDLSRVQAWIDGVPLSDISSSPYVEPGIAVGLDALAIRPGQSGELAVVVPGIEGIFYVGDEEGSVSLRFSPTWFDEDFVHGATDLTLSFHLPPGVKPDEPRWHAAPGGWPQEAPATGLDRDGRVVYTWRNTAANGYTQYIFGASFPAQYVPSGVAQTPSLPQRLNIDPGALFAFACIGLSAIFVIMGFFSNTKAQQRRKLDYLPPKISIEGHGIKRGLTAVEAAILLETPLDRVLTMVLFSLIKKGAGKVTSETPLHVESSTPLPEGLHQYEIDFLIAMSESDTPARQSKLQSLSIDLVRTVQNKMKGFSLRETKDYYQAIVKKAWQQVEDSATPEVRSERFAETLEWTMLDDDFEGGTRRVFRQQPVFLPPWWWLYRPSTPRTTGAGTPSLGKPQPVAGSPSSGKVSLPHLPGSDFAASLVTGIQTTAGKLVSDLTGFTSGVTKTTNPPPPPPKTTPSKSGGLSSGGRPGCACACACACAGCACACAGGGR